MTKQNETQSNKNTKHERVVKMDQNYNITPFNNMDDFTEWKEDFENNPHFHYFALFDSLQELFDTFEHYDFNTQQIEQLLSSRCGNVIEVGIIENEFYTFTSVRM